MLPHIHVGIFEIPTFGLMLLIGMICAFALIYFNRRRIPYSDDDLITMALYAIIGGFLGAKLLYWIVEFDQILADPHFLLESLTSGFVFYGALIVGALSVFLFTHRKKQSFLAYGDLVMPAFILAQGFGRIGCFAAGCCYGAPTGSALGVIYPTGCAAPAGVPLLPTQLFESAFCILFAFVLTAILRKQKRYGLTTGVYLIGYGVWRFVIEFFRSDDRGAVGALSTSQFIGIFIVLAGIALLLLVKAGKTPSVADLMAAAADARQPETDGLGTAADAPSADEQVRDNDDTPSAGARETGDDVPSANDQQSETDESSADAQETAADSADDHSENAQTAEQAGADVSRETSDQ